MALVESLKSDSQALDSLVCQRDTFSKLTKAIRERGLNIGFFDKGKL
jgi:hypothetical protein